MSAAETGRPRSRGRAAARALPAAVLAAVALWQIAAASCPERGVPGDEDWERAAEHLREHRGENELIAFAPAWLEPVGRLHVGDQIPIDMAARIDEARYAGIWELSARGARAPEARGLEPSEEVEFGDLRVRRYEREPAEIVWALREAFPAAEIEGEWASPPEFSLEEVAFEPRRCVRAEPRPGGEIAIELGDVDLGERFVGYAGLADIFTLRDIRDPGHLEVAIDGEAVASLELGIEDGWVRFEAETEPREGARVAFRASADAPERLICFAAEARR